jgi:hypothetical protein
MIFRFALLCYLAPGIALAQSFDHSHSAWGALLAKHVKEARDGLSSRVDYKGFSADRAKLKGYLDTLSAVKPLPNTSAGASRSSSPSWRMPTTASPSRRF